MDAHEVQMKLLASVKRVVDHGMLAAVPELTPALG